MEVYILIIRYENNKKVKVFEWSDSREFMHLTVNLEGEIESIYSSASNANTRKDDAYFLGSVNFFMQSLLKSNVVEFKAMRESLNSKWYKVAENNRIYVANTYDF